MQIPQFWTAFVVAALLSYLLGSLNFALIISRLVVGDDIRRHGSGNAGMTNILRTYGRKYAIATAVGDFAKALLAVVLSRYLFFRMGIEMTVVDPGYIAAIFVLLGHLFPVYFRFKGGKGVVVSLGIMLVTNPLVFIIMMVFFIPFVFIVKIVSLASVLGALVYPVVTFLVFYLQGLPAWSNTIFATILAVIILITHRENIVRLLNGTENKFGKKK